jgi:hypothetical protein
MSDNGLTVRYHSNHYSGHAACPHCEGIIRHKPWCIKGDPVVSYAYQIVADPRNLTAGDALILHSLGVVWGAKVSGQ